MGVTVQQFMITCDVSYDVAYRDCTTWTGDWTFRLTPSLRRSD